MFYLEPDFSKGFVHKLRQNFGFIEAWSCFKLVLIFLNIWGGRKIPKKNPKYSLIEKKIKLNIMNLNSH